MIVRFKFDFACICCAVIVALCAAMPAFAQEDIEQKNIAQETAQEETAQDVALVAVRGPELGTTGRARQPARYCQQPLGAGGQTVSLGQRQGDAHHTGPRQREPALYALRGAVS